MGAYNYIHQCQCPDATVLFTIVRGDAVTWKADAADGGHSCECPVCGCIYRTIDDGFDVGSGGGLAMQNESRPQIDSIAAATSGNIDGGTVVRVNGHAFSHTIPSVLFNGVAAVNVNVIDDDKLDAITPAGSVLANLQGPVYSRLEHGAVTEGPFQVGETITGVTSGITAIVAVVSVSYLLVNNVSSVLFSDGETLSGSASGATTSLSSVSTPNFQVGEPINGLTSGNTGLVSQVSPLRIKQLTGPLSAGEELFGAIDGARALLDATTPTDGLVDVAVANSWGTRAVDYVLTAAFEYTV